MEDRIETPIFLCHMDSNILVPIIFIFMKKQKQNEGISFNHRDNVCFGSALYDTIYKERGLTLIF